MQGFGLNHVSKRLWMAQRILYEFYCKWAHVSNWYVSCCGETGTCTCTRCHWQMHVYNVYCCILFFNRRVNSFRHSGGICRYRFGSTLVQVMVDDTKSFREPVLTYRQWGPIAFIWGWGPFPKIFLSHQSPNLVWQLLIFFLPGLIISVDDAEVR